MYINTESQTVHHTENSVELARSLKEKENLK